LNFLPGLNTQAMCTVYYIIMIQ